MPRFSLVLTTCDRPSLLPASVRAVLDMAYEDYELIVSDNHSGVPAAEILRDVRDSRIRHLRTERRLAAPDHWEFAWNHVQGDYVMCLGDDNALHPDMLGWSDSFIRQHDLDVLSWRSCMYFHPDWTIDYGSFPSRGNILGLQAGTTGELYLCRQDEILQHYCRQLQLVYFPVMCNILFRKSLADDIRRQMGRFFWAPNPDISATYLLLGTARPGRYAYFDSFGSIAGWSQDSNVATMLSRGKASRKCYDYVEEFHGQDALPHHDFKFFAYTNALAATVSQARKLMPEQFGAYDFALETLARRTVENMYVERSVPWIDEPAFLSQVDEFLNSLPAALRSEMFAYRDECMERMRKADAEARTAHASGAHCNQKAEPHWVAGSTTFVDMSLLGAHDIADAARNLARLSDRFDKYDDSVVSTYRGLGIIGASLPIGDAASQHLTGRIKRALSERLSDNNRLQAALSEQCVEAKRLEVTLSGQREETKRLEDTLSDQRAETTRLEAALSDQRAETKRLEATLSDQRAETTRLEAALSDQCAETKRVEAALSEQLSESKRLQAALSRRVAEAKRLEAVLSEQVTERQRLKQQLDAVFDSQGWKLTAPFSKLVQSLRQAVGR